MGWGGRGGGEAGKRRRSGGEETEVRRGRVGGQAGGGDAVVLFVGLCRGPWSSGKPAYITTPRYLKLHNDGERYNAGACAMTNPQSPPTVDDPLSNVFIFAQQNRIHVYLCTPPWQHLQKNKQRPSRSKPPLAEKHTATYTYAVTHRLFSSTLPPETTTYPQKEDAKVPECPHPAPLKTVLNFRGPTTGPCIVPHVMPTTAPHQSLYGHGRRKKRSRPQSQHEQKIAASISTSHVLFLSTPSSSISLFSRGIFPSPSTPSTPQPCLPSLPLAGYQGSTHIQEKKESLSIQRYIPSMPCLFCTFSSKTWPRSRQIEKPQEM